MNIFDVLNRGKSRLHEPSISALLGYLLDSHRDHGLGDSFLRAFLELACDEGSRPMLQPFLDRMFIDSDISLEEPYQLDGARKDIDIQVDLAGENADESCRIIIENKIKVGAANPKQLSDYYLAVLEDDPSLRNLIIIFLTPDASSAPLVAEFESLDVQAGHAKNWLRWNSEEGSVLGIIQKILEQEVRGEITPINEYMRHTLKAFVQHVNATVAVRGSASPRFGEDLGEVADEVTITTGEGRVVRVIRRTSQQIQVLVDGEKMMAKPVLRELISEFDLEVPTDSGNTRQMGRAVMDALKARN